MQTPFTLYPSGRRAILITSASTILALFCIGLGLTGKEIGYIAAAFFVGCGVFGTMEIWPGSSFLRIDETGIRYCYLFSSHHIAWNEIATFETELVNHSGLWGQRMVGFNYANRVEPPNKRYRLDELLPNNFGRDAKSLAQLLNEYRQHFVEDAPAG